MSSILDMRACALSYCNLLCHVQLLSLGGHLFFKGMEEKQILGRREAWQGCGGLERVDGMETECNHNH